MCRSSVRLTTTALKLEHVHGSIKSEKIPLLQQLLTKGAMDPLNKWKKSLEDVKVQSHLHMRAHAHTDTHAHTLQKRMLEREAARKNYDHYLVKLAGLKEAKEKANKKGKPLSQKENERIDRVCVCLYQCLPHCVFVFRTRRNSRMQRTRTCASTKL